MRTMLVMVVLCMGFVLLPQAIGAQGQEQISEYGYSYFTPPENVGTVTTIVGTLEPPVGFTYPFTVNFSAYEYTFYLQTTIVGIDPSPFSIDYYYSDAEIVIYEDPAKDANYGINPPNATSPSTFRSGTIALRGTLSNIARSDDPFGFFDPTLIADCEFTDGTKYNELVQGPNWLMHGGIVLNDPSTPSGYRNAWVMKIFFEGPVSTKTSTWGGIKALYGE
jgi:hypothetical protein